VSSEVEERIHRALARHSLERIEHGYLLVHPQGAGVSLLRLLPPMWSAANGRSCRLLRSWLSMGRAGLPAFHRDRCAEAQLMVGTWAPNHLDNGPLAADGAILHLFQTNPPYIWRRRAFSMHSGVSCRLDDPLRWRPLLPRP